MAATDSQASSTANRRSTILNCALDLFASRGYDAIGVQELVNAAGITKPTLYYYFGSKRGLLETLIQEKLSPFIEQLSSATAYAGDLPLTLQRVVEVYFQFAQQESRFYQLFLSLSYPVPDNEANQLMRPWITRQWQLLESLFQQAAQDHGNMHERHRQYATVFLSILNGYISLIFQQGVEVTEHTIWQVVHQFSHGIYS